MLPASTGNLSTSLRTFFAISCKIQGQFPDEVGNIRSLLDLDLSGINFVGSIPTSIGNLRKLQRFNLSNNKLTGFFGDHICKLQHLGLALLFVPSTFVFVWIRYRSSKRAPQQTDALSFITRERISYYEFLQATDALSESNLIGSRSFGSIYKGVLRSGTAIIVKVFNLQQDSTFKSFDLTCEVLHSLHRRNLVKVMTSCSNLDFKALVLEYMPNRNLEKYLYWHNYFLDIKQKLSIMIDVACALEYHHHRLFAYDSL
ncbi:hypothetical protein CQW23_30181 [Capsicum baccatum]|uniref:Protein kinase domain-containing protein n=1 Tax=Capsicum baccatum TaxID=33114 RepID=A0A2G2VB93_CAPBA|nr:hypothetical protein CQW23_30181 [Capsicum baccatum]